MQLILKNIFILQHRFNPNRSLGFLGAVWQREVLKFFPYRKEGLSGFQRPCQVQNVIILRFPQICRSGDQFVSDSLEELRFCSPSLPCHDKNRIRFWRVVQGL